MGACARDSVYGGGRHLPIDDIGEIPWISVPSCCELVRSTSSKHLGGNQTIHVAVRIAAETKSQYKANGRGREVRCISVRICMIVCMSCPDGHSIARENIPLLISFFTQKYAKKLNRPTKEIPSTTLQAPIRYNCPENISELQNVIERPVILSVGRAAQPGAGLGGTGARIPRALKEPKGTVGAEWRSRPAV
jgi:hydrogenase-4 transcriptional activator